MGFRFLTNGIMGNKSGVLTAVAAAAVLTVSPVGAEANDHVSKQKIEQVTCSTRLACEKLSLSIQAQIDELEAKGFENFTGKDRVKYSELSDSLIAVEKSETQQNEELIAVENNKQIEENQKQAKYAELLGEIRSIKGSL